MGRTLSVATFNAGMIEGRVSFGAAVWQQFGIATTLSKTTGAYSAVFTTKGTTTTLYARVNVNGSTVAVKIGARPIGFHVYGVKVTSTAFKFSIDGVVKASISKTFPSSVQWSAVLSAQNGAPASLLQADWVRVDLFKSGGIFVSPVLDAGWIAQWESITWTANLPAGTSLLVETRGGSSMTPDATWSAWAAVGGNGAVGSGASRYLQYRVTLLTNVAALTPTLQSLTLTWQ